MKALKIIGALLLVVVVAFVIAMFIFPTELVVERSVEINAPKSVVHKHVSSLALMHDWSPWAKTDSTIKWEIVGEDGTVGAIYKWSGEKVGIGEQEFIAIGDDTVKMQVRFTTPFESIADAYIILKELAPTSTQVTWGFASNAGRPGNVFMGLMGAEETVGADYQKGLDSLKVIAEKAAANITYGGFKIEETTFPETHFAFVRDTVKWTEMDTFYSNNLPKIYETLGKGGKTPGYATGLYHTWDEANQQTDLAAAVAYSPVGEVVGYQTSTLSGKAIKIDYYGSYEGVGPAHEALEAYLKEKNLTFKAPAIEQYVTDPMTEADTSKWLTQIYYLVE